VCGTVGVPRRAGFRDIVHAVGADQGGLNELSEARLQLIRRFSALCCHAELLEARLANGEQIDIGEHSNLSSTLVRIASVSVSTVSRKTSRQASVNICASVEILTTRP
jgi:hypothetical protein